MRRYRRGNQAIEFALTFPVLATLLTGVVDFGWYLSNQHVAIDAARVGARSGAVAENGAEPEELAIAATRDALIAEGVTGEAYVDARMSGNAPDRLITVDIRIPYGGLVGLLPMPEHMGASVTMRLEGEEWQETDG